MTQERSKTTQEKLLTAAMQVFHTQGIANTTLQHVAQASGVPVGNVYYHFKTKNDIVQAVINAHRADIQTGFDLAEKNPDPKERLMLFIENGRKNRLSLQQYGCPYAGIAYDLEKEQNPLAEEAGSLLEMWIEFAQKQFTLLGKAKEAKELAETYITTLQGAYLLAHNSGAKQFLERQLNRLELWLKAQ